MEVCIEPLDKAFCWGRHGVENLPHFVRAMFHALLRNTRPEGFPSKTQCLGADVVDYILILILFIIVLLCIVYVCEQCSSHIVWIHTTVIAFRCIVLYLNCTVFVCVVLYRMTIRFCVLYVCVCQKFLWHRQTGLLTGQRGTNWPWTSDGSM